ncbi:hypothetical protein ACWEV3_29480 [Saccharopolyspora sp. NPDC003752]
MLREGRYLPPQIREVLDGLRRTGGSDALRAAIEQCQAALAQREVLDGSSLLRHRLDDESLH